MKHKRLAANAIKKIRSGESLDDGEIAAGIAALEDVVPFLSMCGREYSLVFADLNQKLSQLEGFQQSRRMKR